MKAILIAILILTLALPSFAQPNKRLSAYTYLNEGDLEKAKSDIEDALEHEKTREEAKTWYYAAKIYMAIYNQCQQTSSAFEGYPKDYYLGKAKHAYYKTTTYDMSRLDANRIKNEYQIVGDYMLNEGVALYNNKDYKRAALMFEGTILIKKDFDITDSLAIYNAALAHENAGNVDDAMKHYRKCAEINYQPELAYLSMVLLAKQNGDSDQALKIVKEARKSFPLNPELITAEINLLLSREQYNDALFSIDQGLQVMPENADLHFTRGTILESSDPEESIKCYQRALKINPEHVNALYNLGAAYYNQAVELRNAEGATEDTGSEELKKARKYLEKVEAISPGIEAVQSSLSMIESILQD